MKIQRLKGLFWLGSLAVGGYLAYYVVDFLREKPALEQILTVEKQQAVLAPIKKPAEPEINVVDSKLISKYFREMDWTGKPPPEKPVEAAPVPKEAPKVAVKDLLKVLAVKVDLVNSTQSLGWVKFTNQELALKETSREDRILRIEERLPAPHAGVRVQDITVEGIVFAFDDPEREPETLAPSDYPSERGRIIVVEPGGVIMPAVDPQIRQIADYQPYRPERTTVIKKNEYQIGTGTLQELDADYPRILSRDVRYRTHRDKKTGAVDGIEILGVEPDSLPAQHGLSDGEILKSINGHKVTSVNDAIAYVKSNAETTDTWVAVFEKQGREFTRTYHSPQR
jgi:hypothetical protein